MTTKIYSGWIANQDYGDYESLSINDEPLSDQLEWITETNVSIRYWITDVEATHEEVTEEFIRKLCGVAQVRFSPHYSDITGFLWCDDDLIIGGHDLLQELESYIGKYLILEVTSQ